MHYNHQYGNSLAHWDYQCMTTKVQCKHQHSHHQTHASTYQPSNERVVVFKPFSISYSCIPLAGIPLLVLHCCWPKQQILQLGPGQLLVTAVPTETRPSSSCVNDQTESSMLVSRQLNSSTSTSLKDLPACNLISLGVQSDIPFQDLHRLMQVFCTPDVAFIDQIQLALF